MKASFPSTSPILLALLVGLSALPPAGADGDAPTLPDLPPSEGKLTVHLKIIPSDDPAQSYVEVGCYTSGSLRVDQCMTFGIGGPSLLNECRKPNLPNVIKNAHLTDLFECGEWTYQKMAARVHRRPLLQERLITALRAAIDDAPRAALSSSQGPSNAETLLRHTQTLSASTLRSGDEPHYIHVTLTLYYGGTQSPSHAELCVDGTCTPYDGLTALQAYAASPELPGATVRAALETLSLGETDGGAYHAAIDDAIRPLLDVPAEPAGGSPEAPGVSAGQLSPTTGPAAVSTPGTPEMFRIDAPETPDPTGHNSLRTDTWALDPRPSVEDGPHVPENPLAHSAGGASVTTSGEVGDREYVVEVPAVAPEGGAAPPVSTNPGVFADDSSPPARSAAETKHEQFHVINGRDLSTGNPDDAGSPKAGAGSVALEAKTSESSAANPLDEWVYHALALTSLALAASLALIAAALYSRLRKDRLLNHELRSRLHDLVQRQPGLSTSDAARALDVHVSTLDYHARRLGQAGYLRSVKAGKMRLLWPLEAGAPGAEAAERYWRRSPVKRELLETLSPEVPVSQSELARALGMNRHTLAGHLEVLASAGLVSRQREGRVTLYRLADAGGS